jgi:hypothetical protein
LLLLLFFFYLENTIGYNVKKGSSNGLCRRLTQPCPKQQNFVGFKDIWEESRENIELEEIIGHGNFGEVFRGFYFIFFYEKYRKFKKIY